LLPNQRPFRLSKLIKVREGQVRRVRQMIGWTDSESLQTFDQFPDSVGVALSMRSINC
jgi:hypothetical protein